jgi:rod shape-determining protein MreC
LVFLSLLLLSSNLGGKPTWNPAEQVVVEITAPFQKATQGTIRAVQEIWLSYFNLINVRKENHLLKKELRTLRMESHRHQEMVATNKRLRDLLQFKEVTDWPVVAVQVIGRDPTGWFKSVIIDKGSRAGIMINMPVVDAQGIVGRVVSVSPHYAKVLLVIDQNSAVDCVIQRSREKGIVRGVSDQECDVDYVLKTGDVKIDDRVITSGMGRVFPKGLPIGDVIEIRTEPGNLFKKIQITPSVDFSKLEELLVILKEDPLSVQAKKRE